MSLEEILKNKMNGVGETSSEDLDNEDLSVPKMKSILDTDYTKTKFSKFVQNKKEIENAKKIKLSNIPEGYFEAMDKQNEEMLQSKNKKLPFISDKLSNFIPFYYPNLILVGAETGFGKTTATTNIVYQLYKNKKKSLIISNEELNISVFNRIACLEYGYLPSNMDNFDDKTLKLVAQKRRDLGEFVRVVDINYDNNRTLTSSVEGIEAILESVFVNQDDFDCIILDYYQNISISKKNSMKQKHEVLSEVKSILDKYYKLIKCPIVVFAQLHPSKKEDPSIEARIKEGKSIITASTFVVELSTDVKSKVTQWICHKDRNGSGNKGKCVRTSYDYGKYKDVEQ